jgi:hypothetical protein
VRALLTARKQLQAKLQDIESSIRGILRGFGLKVGTISKAGFEARACELAAGHPMLERIIGAMLKARWRARRVRCAASRTAQVGAGE